MFTRCCDSNFLKKLFAVEETDIKRDIWWIKRVRSINDKSRVVMRETVGHVCTTERSDMRYIYSWNRTNAYAMWQQAGIVRIDFRYAPHTLFISIEPTILRPCRSFLVMLTMRPTWRRACTNIWHFSPLHRKWTLQAALINIDYAKEFSISSADVICVYVYGIVSIEVEVLFFTLYILRFITSAFVKFFPRGINIEETLSPN